MQEMALNMGPWGLWPAVLETALGIFVILAATGLPFMASSVLALAVKERSSRYVHLARQLLVLCLIATWLLTLLCAGVPFTPGIRELAAAFPAALLPIMGGACAAGALLCTLAVSGWKRFPQGRRFLALLIGFSLLVAVLAGLWAALKSLFPDHMHVLALWVTSLLATGAVPPTTGSDTVAFANLALFPLLTALVVVLALRASSASVALPWLILRRSADDLGRDYYTFALRWCARRGITGIILLYCGVAALGMVSMLIFVFLPGITPALQTEVLRNAAGDMADLWFRLLDLGIENAEQSPATALVPLFVFTLLFLKSTALLWNRVRKAEVPMRSKIAICTGPFFVVLSLACVIMLMLLTRPLPGMTF